MINYLTGSEYITHDLVNELYSEIDSKMVKMLSSGKSFILAGGDGNGNVGDWSVYPMYSLIGQPFFFFTGVPSIIDNIIGYEGISYNHTPFTNAQNATSIDYIDVTGQVAYTQNIFDEFGQTYYTQIGKFYGQSEAEELTSFFDYSLEAHKISGNYISERYGSTVFGVNADYHLPERHLNYGLADVFCENISNLTWETEWNKYKCLRFHNFNSTGRLNLTFEETSQNFQLLPFDCRSFRNHTGIWEESQFRYFFDYKSGDPLSYYYWPKSNHNNPWGKAGIAGYYVPTSRNSQAANNLLNFSLPLNFIDIFSYKNGALTTTERDLGSYPDLNAGFHYLQYENGADITNLYCINNPNNFSGYYYSGSERVVFNQTEYYKYGQKLDFPSGASNVNFEITFPRPSQAVTLDLIPVYNYGPNYANIYGKYQGSNDWIRLDYHSLSGWTAGQRKNLYIHNNRPFTSYKVNLGGFETSHLSFGLSGLEFHGLFDDPRESNTIIGNLFYHRGELLKAKISKTEKCIDGYTPVSTFERIVFNGLDKISDWESDYLIGITEESDGKLSLSNLDPDYYVDLIPISTNLLKIGGYDYSVISGFMPISLDNGGVQIDNHIFEINSFSANSIYTTYPGKATHLYGAANSFLNDTQPPVLFAKLNLQNSTTSGTFAEYTWGSDYSWNPWQAGTGYVFNSRVTLDGQRFVNTYDPNSNQLDLNTGHPRGAGWSKLTTYGEPYNSAYEVNTGDVYAMSGILFYYGNFQQSEFLSPIYYDVYHTGVIDSKQGDYYQNYFRQDWFLSGTQVTATWGTQYTGIIKLHSDTISSISNPSIYGYQAGGLNSVGSISYKYEPDGLAFSCTETLEVPQAVQIRFNEDDYGKFYGAFTGDNPFSRPRKGWFKGNGFGYIGNYLFGNNNWLGANANSFFISPRFPRAYSSYNGAYDSTRYFNLISGDETRASGLDFIVLREESPNLISDIQVLHSINPNIATEGSSFYSNIFTSNGQHNFHYYKNDRQVENAYFDKDSLDLSSGDGFFYSAFRPENYPLGTVGIDPDDDAFRENFFLGYNRHFHVPLYSEHYNLVAQATNQCRYAEPLKIQDFIYWTYSGGSFKISQWNDNLINLAAIKDYAGPALGNTNITYNNGTTLNGNNHLKLLPTDYMIGFNQSGDYHIVPSYMAHASYFRQFFIELGIPIKDRNNLPTSLWAASTGDSGQLITKYPEIKYSISEPPKALLTLDTSVNPVVVASGDILKIENVNIFGDSQQISSPINGDFYGYLDNYANFNYITYTDWNAYLNTIGLNIPMMDSFVPLKLDRINISTQATREQQFPTGNNVITYYGPEYHGFLTTTVYSGVFPDGAFVQVPIPTEGECFGFSGILNETQLIYTGVNQPVGVTIRASHDSERYFSVIEGVNTFYTYMEEDIGHDEIAVDVNGSVWSLFWTPKTITRVENSKIAVFLGSLSPLYALINSVTSFGDYQCYASGTFYGSETIAYDTNLGPFYSNPYSIYYDSTSGADLKAYYLNNNNWNNTEVMSKEQLTIDGYKVKNFSPYWFDSFYNFDGADDTSIKNDNSIIIGEEFVIDDDYKKDIAGNSQIAGKVNGDWNWTLGRRINYYNGSPALTVKYSALGERRGYYNDEPLTTEGNYLKQKYGTNAGYYSFYPTPDSQQSKVEIINEYPYLIEPIGTGQWRAYLDSPLTIDI